MTKEYQRELEEKGILPILTEKEDKALWEGLMSDSEEKKSQVLEQQKKWNYETAWHYKLNWN